MPNYEKLYHIMFNAVTDAIEELRLLHTPEAISILVSAQQSAEEEYLNSGD